MQTKPWGRWSPYALLSKGVGVPWYNDAQYANYSAGWDFNNNRGFLPALDGSSNPIYTATGGVYPKRSCTFAEFQSGTENPQTTNGKRQHYHTGTATQLTATAATLAVYQQTNGAIIFKGQDPDETANVFIVTGASQNLLRKNTQSQMLSNNGSANITVTGDNVNINLVERFGAGARWTSTTARAAAFNQSTVTTSATARGATTALKFGGVDAQGSVYVDFIGISVANLSDADFQALCVPGPAPADPASVVYTLPGSGAIDVIVVAGQSNAAASAVDDGNLIYTPDPGVIVWNDTTKAWVQYHPQRTGGMVSGSFAGRWGWEMEIARQYRAANPTKPFAIIKNAWPSTQLYSSGSGVVQDWNVSSTGELYDQTATMITAALAALVTAGYTPTIKGTVWSQGENDAADTTMASAYETNLTNLIAGMRSTWSIGASSPISIVKIKGSGLTFASTVQTAQGNVDTADATVSLLDTSAYAQNSDAIHFKKPGLIAGGQTIYGVFYPS